jgi:hypothetical protein
MHGTSSLLLKELALQDISKHKHCMTSPATFEIIHTKFTATIQRTDTAMKEAIPAGMKLKVILSFLSAGNSTRNPQQSFRVSTTAISIFIPEACGAIFDSLKKFSHLFIL